MLQLTAGEPAAPNPDRQDPYPNVRRTRASGTTGLQRSRVARTHSFTRSAGLAFPGAAEVLTLVAVLPSAAFASAGLVRATSTANRSASESSFEALPAARDFFI